MNDKLSIPLSIIVAGLLIGGGVYLGKTKNNLAVQNPISQVVEKSKKIRPIDKNDHIIGDPEARIIIVQYSDIECAFCKEFHKTMETIMSNYGTRGEVAWVFRHLPIVELHSKSLKEAEALECAGDLGGNIKFWEYLKKIYEITSSDNKLDPQELINASKQIGLSGMQFEECLNSGKYVDKITKDIEDAKNAGANGSPYSIIIDTKNGETYPIVGAQPYSIIKEIIGLLLIN